MATKRTTKRYEESFKQAALARIDKGEAVLAVAKDLKVHESILYGWKARRQQMAEQGGKPNAAANLKDAIILLQKAKDSMTRDLKSGKIKHFSRSQLLTLMALGMMMVPPGTMSLPIKLLLFVVVDGWHLVVGSLLRSYT